MQKIVLSIYTTTCIQHFTHNMIFFYNGLFFVVENLVLMWTVFASLVCKDIRIRGADFQDSIRAHNMILDLFSLSFSSTSTPAATIHVMWNNVVFLSLLVIAKAPKLSNMFKKQPVRAQKEIKFIWFHAK